MSPTLEPPDLLDVVVAGDGPAGAAVAAAADAAGLRTVLVGSGRPWTNTYGAWVDEVPAMPDTALVPPSCTSTAEICSISSGLAST